MPCAPSPTRKPRRCAPSRFRRRQLTELVAIEKTRLKQAIEPLVVASHKAAIAALTQALKAIEEKIAARIAKDPERDQARRLLLSIPGIGERVSSVLLTELPDPRIKSGDGATARPGLPPTSPSPAPHRPAPPSPADDPACAPPSP